MNCPEQPSADVILRAIAEGADPGPWLMPIAGSTLQLLDLITPTSGLADYALADGAMQRLVERPVGDPDVLLLLQHPPVATLGRRGGRENLRDTVWHDEQGEAIAVAVHETARGGNLTMHAPGQLVGYPIAQLPQLQMPIGRGSIGDLPAYVRALQDAIIASCGNFGVAAQGSEGFPGVWCNERDKIASIGVGVRRGWSFHGFAVNVDPILGLFSLMTPCGLQGVRLTSLCEQLRARGEPVPALEPFAADLAVQLGHRLNRVATHAAAADR